MKVGMMPIASGVLGGHVARWMHGRMCLMGGVFGDSVHRVAY